MRMVLIADKDVQTRKRIVDLFGGTDYKVVTADSVVDVLRDVLEKDAKVILLGSEFDNLAAKDLVPLLKQCNQNLTIILVSNEQSLPLLRRFRREGIFYHALTPTTSEDKEELLQAVQCAFDNQPGEAAGRDSAGRSRS